MSTTQDYIDYLFDQIDHQNKRYKKMFGEFMIYINDKPILLVCDNTVYVKQMDCIKELFPSDCKGFPYKGAKEHFIVDIDDKNLLNLTIERLEKVISIPAKKRKRK